MVWEKLETLKRTKGSKNMVRFIENGEKKKSEMEKCKKKVWKESTRIGLPWGKGC